MMLDGVPALSSERSGTGTVLSCSREVLTRSLPNHHLNLGHEHFAVQSACNFSGISRLEEQLESFDQILARGFNPVALAGDVQFRAKGHVGIFLALDNRGQSASGLHGPDCTPTHIGCSRGGVTDAKAHFGDRTRSPLARGPTHRRPDRIRPRQPRARLRCGRSPTRLLTELRFYSLFRYASSAGRSSAVTKPRSTVTASDDTKGGRLRFGTNGGELIRSARRKSAS
jgi:hypothetical protein